VTFHKLLILAISSALGSDADKDTGGKTMSGVVAEDLYSFQMNHKK
jgi:hypothetical protein